MHKVLCDVIISICFKHLIPYHIWFTIALLRHWYNLLVWLDDSLEISKRLNWTSVHNKDPDLDTPTLSWYRTGHPYLTLSRIGQSTWPRADHHLSDPDPEKVTHNNTCHDLDPVWDIPTWPWFIIQHLYLTLPPTPLPYCEAGSPIYITLIQNYTNPDPKLKTQS